VEVVVDTTEVDPWIIADHLADKEVKWHPGANPEIIMTTMGLAVATKATAAVATKATEVVPAEAMAIPIPGTGLAAEATAVAATATTAPSIPAGTTIQVVAKEVEAPAGIEVGVRTLAGTTTIVTEEEAQEVMEVTVQEEVIRVIEEEDKVKQVVQCAEVLTTEATEEVEDAPRPIL